MDHSGIAVRDLYRFTVRIQEILPDKLPVLVIGRLDVAGTVLPDQKSSQVVIPGLQDHILVRIVGHAGDGIVTFHGEPSACAIVGFLRYVPVFIKGLQDPGYTGSFRGLTVRTKITGLNGVSILIILISHRCISGDRRGRLTIHPEIRFRCHFLIFIVLAGHGRIASSTRAAVIDRYAKRISLLIEIPLGNHIPGFVVILLDTSVALYGKKGRAISVKVLFGNHTLIFIIRP